LGAKRKGGGGETARVLVEMGSDVHAQQDVYGGTPLHLASAQGHTETVRVLVEMGSDVHAQGINKLTPLHMAARYGRVETLRILVKLLIGDALPQNAYGRTPLHVAARLGHVETVRLLVEEMGSNVLAAQDQNGDTPLHHAAERLYSAA
jgi:ankyrin